MTGEAIAEIVRRYGAAWNETNESNVAEALRAAWADGGTYTDPSAHVEGRDALLRHILAFHQRFPGAKLVFTSGVDSHHSWLRFSWRIVDANGQAVMDGTDIGEVDDSLRLHRIVGFFGPPPL